MGVAEHPPCARVGADASSHRFSSRPLDKPGHKTPRPSRAPALQGFRPGSHPGARGPRPRTSSARRRRPRISGDRPPLAAPQAQEGRAARLWLRLYFQL